MAFDLHFFKGRDGKWKVSGTTPSGRRTRPAPVPPWLPAQDLLEELSALENEETDDK